MSEPRDLVSAMSKSELNSLYNQLREHTEEGKEIPKNPSSVHNLLVIVNCIEQPDNLIIEKLIVLIEEKPYLVQTLDKNCPQNF